MTQSAPSISDLLPGSRRIEVMAHGAGYAVHRWARAGAPAGPGAVAGSSPRTEPAAVLLHGVPQTSACWRDLAPVLAEDRDVLAVDLKGLGDSQVSGRYDVATLARELREVIRAIAGDRPVDLVGHDWGGALAIAVAVRHPEAVRRLVVISAPYRKVNYVKAAHMPAFALPWVPEHAIGIRGEAFVDDMLRYAWRGESLAPEVSAHYRAAYRDPERVRAMLGYYRSAVRTRLTTGVRGLGRSALSAPGRLSSGAGGNAFAAATAQASSAGAAIHVERHLVLWGAADPVLPVSVGEAVCAEMADPFTMVTVPGVGHFPVEEAPAFSVGLISDFLRD